MEKKGPHIELAGYRLHPEPYTKGKFELIKSMVATKGKYIGREYDSILGHGMTILRCIEIISKEQAWDNVKKQDLYTYFQKVEENIKILLEEFRKEITNASEEFWKKDAKGFYGNK